MRWIVFAFEIHIAVVHFVMAGVANFDVYRMWLTNFFRLHRTHWAAHADHI